MTISSRIVVVAEDELLVRLMAVEALVDAGFHVIEAGHAGEAVAILTSHAEHVCLLFTDIHMPGAMDGVALAHHVRAHWPWIALLIASGRATPRADEIPAGSRFLPKPYHPDHLIAYVRELAAA